MQSSMQLLHPCIQVLHMRAVHLSRSTLAVVHALQKSRCHSFANQHSDTAAAAPVRPLAAGPAGVLPLPVLRAPMMPATCVPAVTAGRVQRTSATGTTNNGQGRSVSGGCEPYAAAGMHL
jgi:hypothetical protein